MYAYTIWNVSVSAESGRNRDEPYVVYACFAISHLTSLLTSVRGHGNTPGVHHFRSDVYVPENKSNVHALLIHCQYAYTTLPIVCRN
jgi:hypothetical protein